MTEYEEHISNIQFYKQMINEYRDNLEQYKNYETLHNEEYWNELLTNELFKGDR